MSERTLAEQIRDAACREWGELPDLPPMETAPINRRALYSIGAWLLYAITFVTAYGMSYPLVLSLAGQKPKIIEEVIYHQNLVWFFPPLMIAMAIAPWMFKVHAKLAVIASKIVDLCNKMDRSVEEHHQIWQICNRHQSRLDMLDIKIAHLQSQEQDD